MLIFLGRIVQKGNDWKLLRIQLSFLVLSYQRQWFSLIFRTPKSSSWTFVTEYVITHFFSIARFLCRMIIQMLDLPNSSGLRCMLGKLYKRINRELKNFAITINLTDTNGISANFAMIRKPIMKLTIIVRIRCWRISDDCQLIRLSEKFDKKVSGIK